MQNKYIEKPKNCTGCGLCSNVCSRDAIQMVWNKEGFLSPLVNTSICINCGLCAKMCPVQPEYPKTEDNEVDITKISTFGAWNNDVSTLQQSSSGGLFCAIAEKIILAGGCVFGVIWKDKVTATFAKAEAMEQLTPMRGSKYVQALPGSVYREVKKELQTGREVLFTGTACQVYALKRFLRKPYRNLYTIDILCHGVPSRNLLQAYVNHYEQEQCQELREIFFRHKDGNWNKYKIKKIFETGNSISHTHSKDMFMQLFIGDYFLNHACYHCQYAHIPRPSDITLGDFWGNLSKHHPDWPIKHGISSVIANTIPGLQLLRNLNSDDKISLREVPFAEMYNGQASVYIAVQRQQDNRERAFKLIQKSLLTAYNYLIESEKIHGIRLYRNGLMFRLLQTLSKIKRMLIKG